MPRSTMLLMLLVLAAPAAAQDEPAPEPQADETATAEAAGDAEDVAEDGPDAAGDGIDPELFEDTELDEQTYEEDEDEFIPTEEIPADEPIPFPTNI